MHSFYRLSNTARMTEICIRATARLGGVDGDSHCPYSYQRQCVHLPLIIIPLRSRHPPTHPPTPNARHPLAIIVFVAYNSQPCYYLQLNCPTICKSVITCRLCVLCFAMLMTRKEFSTHLFSHQLITRTEFSIHIFSPQLITRTEFSIHLFSHQLITRTIFSTHLISPQLITRTEFSTHLFSTQLVTRTEFSIHLFSPQLITKKEFSKHSPLDVIVV